MIFGSIIWGYFRVLGPQIWTELRSRRYKETPKWRGDEDEVSYGEIPGSDVTLTHFQGHIAQLFDLEVWEPRNRRSRDCCLLPSYVSNALVSTPFCLASLIKSNAPIGLFSRQYTKRKLDL